MHINEVTEKIIGCAIEVHRQLGPGFFESVYQSALAYELIQSGLRFEREKILPVSYKGIVLDAGFRCDFLVEDCVVVECKAIKELTAIDQAQALNYLKITQLQVALVINFHSMKLVDGIKRIVNQYRPT